MDIGTLNEETHELAIVVNTCDAYSDVLDLYFLAFDEYWPNCEYKIHINTESKVSDRPGVISHTSKGSVGWGDRLIEVLKAIESEFVLVAYDDFLLESYVDLEAIKNCLEFLKSNPKTSCFYLIDTNLPVNSDITVGSFDLVQSRCEYRLNSAPAIWRKKDLIYYTGPQDSPWAWEVFGSYKTFSEGNDFFTIKKGKDDVYPYNYTKGGAIYRGKWVKSIVDPKIEKYNVLLDTTIRGYSDDSIKEVRSITWKFKFMYLGFQMIGFKSVYFLINYIKAKLK